MLGFPRPTRQLPTGLQYFLLRSLLRGLASSPISSPTSHQSRTVDASEVCPISDVVLFHCKRVRSDYNLPNILFSRLLRLAICPSAAGCGWLDLMLVWYSLVRHVVQLGLEHAQYQRVMHVMCGVYLLMNEREAYASHEEMGGRREQVQEMAL